MTQDKPLPMTPEEIAELKSDTTDYVYPPTGRLIATIEHLQAQLALVIADRNEQAVVIDQLARVYAALEGSHEPR